MPDPPNSLKLAPPEWEQLRDLVDRFEEAWKREGGVDLAGYLPPREDPLRGAVLRELVRTDLELCCRVGRPVDAADYFRRFPELGAADDVPASLLFEEYRLRQRFGQPVSLEHYRSRYPRQYDELERLIGQAGGTLNEKRAPAAASPPRVEPPMPDSSSEILPVDQGYRLVRVIGRGTFGEVWEARAPGEFPAAVKIIPRTIDSEEVQRERRALDVVRRMHHHNLLQVQAAWHLEDRLVIVMELADWSLRDRLRECQKAGKKGIPRRELIGYMRETAAALDYLHGKEVCHRDIKPDNILLRGGVVKVADFGLLRDQKAATMFRPVGTPPYMPPEVWNCQGVFASDQYSLACTYAELRCGRRPFGQRTADELSRAHRQDPPDLSLLSLPEQRVLGRALAKQPEQRFASCGEFVRALDAALAGRPSSVSEIPVQPVELSRQERTDIDGSLLPGAPPLAELKTPSDLEIEHTATLDKPPARQEDWRAPPPPPFRRMILAAAGTLCLLVLGGLGYFLWSRYFRPLPGAVALAPGAPAVSLAPGGPPRQLELTIDRHGFEGAIELTFTADPDIEINPATIPPGESSVKVGLAVKGSPNWGKRVIKATARPGRPDDSLDIEVHVLPAGFEPAPEATVDRDGEPCFSRIVRRIGTEEVPFVLIRPASDPDRAFYLMENKVWNALFAVFAAEKAEALARSSWRSGGQAGGEDLRAGNGRLPVFRVTRPEAEQFAEWLGGRLPGAAHLDEAGRSARGSPAVGRWQEGPRETAPAEGGVRDLDGNGREWTRDEVTTEGGETLAILRGRSYAAAGVSAAGVQDPRTQPTQYPSHASPFTSFRVVIERPSP
jgi:serine/threonine protein kinase